jgi:hypothetical protein
VLRVNIAKPLKAKLGHAKPVWAHDEFFAALGEDRELADAEEVTLWHSLANLFLSRNSTLARSPLATSHRIAFRVISLQRTFLFQDAHVVTGDQDLTPMDKSLAAMRAAAKAKGLFVE